MADTSTKKEPSRETEGQVSDAVSGNWVDRFAPVATRPYLRLSRADRPIGTWLLLLPCWMSLALAILSDGRASPSDLWVAIGCALGAFLMRGAGCTWNDITDREIDAQVARTRSRPLPSGQVSTKQAAVWMALQTAVSAAILLTFNTNAILLGLASLIPVAIYPFAKRFTWWPQVFLGLAFNWGALLAWTAHTGTLSAPAVVLYIAGITWTLFYDTIYAHQDVEDDALIGVKSTARLFGDNSPQWLQGFLMATIMLFGLAVLMVTIDRSPASMAVALLGPMAMGWHMQWQLRQLDTDDASVLVRLFRSNRDAGLIPLLFFAGAFFL
ncbi:4-hydroxybenzoate octaprenyltransferase [Shimia sp. NS0008-38b]|uniref:4-hydroxybenzoate octaprenyltransferase n=1 Tax=Shimia sp. NS0008-38b TaxID=3127653 RepID=UPI00310968A6